MTVQKEVEDRLQFLDRFVKATIREARIGVPLRAPRFVIARRWGSWYPSLFNVEGGCYAIVTRQKEQNVTVIDPGFNFLATLNYVLPIEAQDIRNIIVTHFHPDHAAGLEQFLTLAFESGFPCDIYVSESGYEFFKPFQAERMRIHEMQQGQIYRLANYEVDGGAFEEIAFKPFKTYHCEIGLRHRTLGLSIEINTPLKKGKDDPYKLVILGDTDGRPEYVNEYVQVCQPADVVVCHLGTYSEKSCGCGYGHMLIPGVRNLLTSLFKQQNTETKLFLLSEFGFEMASLKEITKKMDPFYRSRKNQLLLFLGSTLLSDGPDAEKHVFSNLTYRSMVDALSIDESDFIRWSDLSFHFEVLLYLSLRRH